MMDDGGWRREGRVEGAGGETRPEEVWLVVLIVWYSPGGYSSLCRERDNTPYHRLTVTPGPRVAAIANRSNNLNFLKVLIADRSTQETTDYRLFSTLPDPLSHQATTCSGLRP